MEPGMTFKGGDRVSRRDGGTFSNGNHVVTVKAPSASLPYAIWFEETDTWSSASSLQLVSSAPMEDLFPETPKVTRQSVLDEASKLINEDRASDYGDPKVMHQLIGDFWSTYLGLETKLTPDQVGMMMALMKIARSTSSPKFDTYVDLAGYAALAGEMSIQG